MSIQEIGNCPLCRIDINLTQKNENNEFKINCNDCGEYTLTEEIFRIMRNHHDNFKHNLHNIRGWMRENLDTFTATEDILKLRLIRSPSVNEKKDKILRCFYDITNYPGADICIDEKPKCLIDGTNCSLRTVAWAKNEYEVSYFLDYLEKTGYIQKGKKLYPKDTRQIYNLTPLGIKSVTKNNANSNVCFCAMQFSDEMQTVYEKMLSKAVMESGYTPIKVDEAPHNDGIVDKIMSLIRQSKFIIADLTGNRGGVYFEAGFAKGLGREVIFTCEKSAFKKESIHFDVQHLNFLLWEKNNHPKNVERLKNRIISTIGEGKYLPVSAK